MYTRPFRLSGVTVVPFNDIFPARNSTKYLVEDPREPGTRLGNRAPEVVILAVLTLGLGAPSGLALPPRRLPGPSRSICYPQGPRWGTRAAPRPSPKPGGPLQVERRGAEGSRARRGRCPGEGRLSPACSGSSSFGCCARRFVLSTACARAPPARRPGARRAAVSRRHRHSRHRSRGPRTCQAAMKSFSQ